MTLLSLSFGVYRYSKYFFFQSLLYLSFGVYRIIDRIGPFLFPTEIKYLSTKERRKIGNGKKRRKKTKIRRDNKVLVVQEIKSLKIV